MKMTIETAEPPVSESTFDHIDNTPTKSVRVTVNVHPERHPRYQNLFDKYPPTGAQAALRLLLVHSWEEARNVVEAYRRNDVEWMKAWKAGKKKLPEPQTTEEVVEQPIVDLHNRSQPNHQYTIYLSPANPVHKEILDYRDSLPKREIRPMFLRLALVLSSEDPDIEKLTAGL